MGLYKNLTFILFFFPYRNVLFILNVTAFEYVSAVEVLKTKDNGYWKDAGINNFCICINNYTFQQCPLCNLCINFKSKYYKMISTPHTLIINKFIIDYLVICELFFFFFFFFFFLISLKGCLVLKFKSKSN